MLYCLFRHMFADGLRDVVVRAGQRVLVRRASLRLIKSLAAKIGMKITQRATGKVIARWLPVVGAVSVGAYAAYDTAKVAEAAVELFSQEVVVEEPPACPRARRRGCAASSCDDVELPVLARGPQRFRLHGRRA